ncbi:MAG: hypothetical protein KDB94_10740 [Acidobacteria bacterium]|nr:hypothetical protein [Acidobacteriota bacterium]MCB9378260.1 hypothetical protein [Holophagales bacterium]
MLALALAVAFWSGRPHGAIAAEPVDWRREPVQEPTERKPFRIETRHGFVRVTPRASYDVAARVEGSERYWFDATAFLSPVDLVLTWGELPEARWRDALDYSQSWRFYFWRTEDLELDASYVIQHSANTHMIPASADVRRALLAIGRGDEVRLRGLLVDVHGDRLVWKTSTVRTDHGDHGCEILWVESVQIGRRLYLAPPPPTG